MAFTIPTLDSLIGVGGEFSVEVISVGHTLFLVRLEIMWVYDHESLPKFS